MAISSRARKSRSNKAVVEDSLADLQKILDRVVLNSSGLVTSLSPAEPELRKVKVKLLNNGSLFVKPVSARALYSISMLQGTGDLGKLCHGISEFMADTICKDEAGTPLLTYDFWMRFTPDQLLTIFNAITDSLGSGGDEKNG